jgi:hypothetical protein
VTRSASALALCCNGEWRCERERGTLEYIEWNGRPRGVEFVDDLPDDWAAQVYSWLFDNGYYFSEEGSGVYLYTRKEDEDEVLAKALLDLGLAEREDDEE